MTNRIRTLALVVSVLLFLAGAWGQSMHGTRVLLTERGQIKMSALPPFSPDEVTASEAGEEAPSHRSVPDFPMPASHLSKTSLAAASTASGSANPSAVTAVVKTASVKAASSFNGLSSPPPALSFQAMPMLSNYPPDTTGAIGPNNVVSASTDRLVIQDRQGNQISSTSLNSFWDGAFSDISPAWDPNVRYDPYADRWIFVCMGNYNEAGSSMLIAVSATSDPTGSWYLRRVFSDGATKTSSTKTFDHPRVGFNNNWIVVTGNEIQNSTGNWIYSVVYAYDKADLYANGTRTPVEWSNITNDFTLTPALTYDSTVNTMYIMANYNGNSSGMGYLSLSTITGAVGSEVLSLNVAFPGTTNTWASTVSGQQEISGSGVKQNFAPQLGTSNTIGVFDARMNTVVYRNGSLWATHTVFVPASAPTISAVDWWQVGTDGTVQQFGRLQDPNSLYFYTYPSLAVNVNGDMLVGYSRMASTQYASAAYAFRAAADPAGTLRTEYVAEAGKGQYSRYDGNNVNRWGDYSATQVDPINDTDFWTIQEYAQSTSSQWAMWWASIIPPGTSAASLQSVSVNPASVTGGQTSTGTITLTNGAPSGGAVVTVSSNSASAQVPSGGTVTVPSGSNTATFNITTSTVSSNTTATITASYNSVNQVANLTIKPVAAPSYALAVSSSSSRSGAVALQGATLSGSEYVFTSPAGSPTNFNPTGISNVCYWLDNTAMSGTATHCESATPYDFAGTGTPTSIANPWSTTAVANGSHTITQLVTLSAGGTETDTASFTVSNGAAPALRSLAVNPSTVTGGQSSTGTVTLTSAAPASGAVVSLSSNSTSATVQSTVTVPSGSTAATFPISTTGVTAITQATISALYNSVTQTANLTINPVGTVSLSVVQAQQNFNSNSAASITANITTTAGDLLVAYVREGSNTTDQFTVTDNLGQTWTLAGYNTFNSTNRSGIYYRPNSGAITSVTSNFTTSGGVTRPGIVVYEIAGAAASSPLDAGPVANTFGTTSSLTSAALTTSNANDILLLAVDVATSQSGTNDSFVPGTGFAFPITGSATNPRQAVIYEIVSAKQTSAKASISWATSAGNSGSQFIAFHVGP